MSILTAAAAVLRCFAGSRHDVTVTDLVVLLGMPKSNASRLLRAMRDAGLLETVGDSKRYRPSALLQQAGQIFRLSATLIDRADQAVIVVAEDTGHTGYVSLRRGSEIVGVTVHPGRRPVRVVTELGELLPAFATSTGRALLARLPDDSVRELYAGGLPASSGTAPTTVEALLERLTAVRARGYAESDDEAVRGVAAVSVAVGDPVTGEAVALCIAFPAASVGGEERLAVVRSLGSAAAAVAAATGDPSFFPLDLSAE